MKRSVKKASNRVVNPQPYIGYQWGEPPNGESSFLVNRVGEELEITAAMPEYLSDDRPCDFVRKYEIARKNRSIGKQRTGKDSPHIRFANADSDDALIDFVRGFGPVVSKNWKMLPFDPRIRPEGAAESEVQMLMRAQQNLQELRIEQRIYKAALGLVVELVKRPAEYDFTSAKQWMVEIALNIQDWPRQWNREKKERGQNPLWRVRGDAMRRIAAVARSGPDLLLPPQVDARIVICELVNVFPLLAFPNPPEMHSYFLFGIRPLLYSVLRWEFLQSRDVSVCAKTQCRAFFEVERTGQRFCDEVCSRQHRQREYWKDHGKTARKKRLAAPIKHPNL